MRWALGPGTGIGTRDGGWDPEMGVGTWDWCWDQRRALGPEALRPETDVETEMLPTML